MQITLTAESYSTLISHSCQAFLRLFNKGLINSSLACVAVLHDNITTIPKAFLDYNHTGIPFSEIISCIIVPCGETSGAASQKGKFRIDQARIPRDRFLEPDLTYKQLKKMRMDYEDETPQQSTKSGITKSGGQGDAERVAKGSAQASNGAPKPVKETSEHNASSQPPGKIPPSRSRDASLAPEKSSHDKRSAANRSSSAPPTGGRRTRG